MCYHKCHVSVSTNVSMCNQSVQNKKRCVYELIFQI